jgi:hypothetical protein
MCLESRVFGKLPRPTVPGGEVTENPVLRALRTDGPNRPLDSAVIDGYNLANTMRANLGTMLMALGGGTLGGAAIAACAIFAVLHGTVKFHHLEILNDNGGPAMDISPGKNGDARINFYNRDHISILSIGSQVQGAPNSPLTPHESFADSSGRNAVNIAVEGEGKSVIAMTGFGRTCLIAVGYYRRSLQTSDLPSGINGLGAIYPAKGCGIPSHTPRRKPFS